jgi:tetratricopeptide (TPR) repeat protein
MVTTPQKMSSRILWSAIWLSVIALIGLGCSSGALNTQTAAEQGGKADSTAFVAKPARPQFERMDYRAYQYYVTGLLFEGYGDYYSASVAYKNALKYYPNSPELSLSYGKMLFFLQEYADALKALQNAEPQNADLLSLSARCYHALGMTDSVRSTYLKLVELEPDNSLAFSFLAGFYRQVGNIDSTIWAYENLVRIRPDSYRQFNELARLYAQRQDLDSAKQTFRRSFAIDSSNSNMIAIIGLAELYMMRDQTDSAIITFERGLKIDPNNLVIHRELTGLYARQDSLMTALEHAKKVTELSPMDRAGVRRLGILYFSVDSLDAADSILSSLVEAGERNSSDHFYLGRIAALRQNWDRARDEFMVVTQLADSIDQSWLDLGFAYRQLGRRDQEIQTYQTGLAHMRDEKSAINLSFALGAAYEQAGRVDDAVATFEEIIAHDPEHAQSLNYLGYMLAERGERLDYAKELIERAVRLAPDNAAYLDSYGWVCYRLGDYREALKYLQKAVELDIDPVIFDHLGDTFHALGETGKAKEWWEKALEQQPENENIKEKLNR